jgi:hypothetical protein
VLHVSALFIDPNQLTQYVKTYVHTPQIIIIICELANLPEQYFSPFIPQQMQIKTIKGLKSKNVT